VRHAIDQFDFGHYARAQAPDQGRWRSRGSVAFLKSSAAERLAELDAE
jgi:hypothetical protein